MWWCFRILVIWCSKLVCFLIGVCDYDLNVFFVFFNNVVIFLEEWSFIWLIIFLWFVGFFIVREFLGILFKLIWCFVNYVFRFFLNGVMILILVKFMFFELVCFLLYKLIGILICVLYLLCKFCSVFIGLGKSDLIGLVVLIIVFMNDELVLFFNKWWIKYVSKFLCWLIGV